MTDIKLETLKAKVDHLERMLIYAPPDMRSKISTLREALEQIRAQDPGVFQIAILLTAMHLDIELLSKKMNLGPMTGPRNPQNTDETNRTH